MFAWLIACRFEEHSFTLQQTNMYDLEGNLLRTGAGFSEAQQELFKKYGKRNIVLGWHEIRQLLYNHLPPQVVEFDKQVLPQLANALYFDLQQPRDSVVSTLMKVTTLQQSPCLLI